MTLPLLSWRRVSRVFDGPPTVRALDQVDLRVDPGDYMTVVGPSGSGKSTLLNILGLLDRPTSGTYELNGVDTSRLSERERAHWRARVLGFVFQDFHLLAHRTALDNVALVGLYSGVPYAARLRLATEALTKVGLGARLSALPTTMSGGERQRVAIARALVSRPQLLLCDEPTGNLDSATGGAILDLLDELHSDGATIVMITHDPRVAARGDQRLTVTDGRAAIDER